ncbi:hypothetical protein EMIT0P253_40155 [Pseudomonas sp. IT-P253]
MPDHSLVAGELNQVKSGKVRQALIAQKNIERFYRLEHLLQGAFSTVGGSQLGEAVTFKQVLSRPELKRMIFHQQDAQIVFEHRIIHASSVDQREMTLFRETTEQSVSLLSTRCRAIQRGLNVVDFLVGDWPFRVS